MDCSIIIIRLSLGERRRYERQKKIKYF